MSGYVTWTSENDEQLIDFVKNHEALYNIKSKDYRQAQMKQNLWNEIGITLQKSGSDCCKRWAYVRDYYIRRKGKPGSGGEAAKKRSVLLSFLDSLPSSQRHNTISDKELDAKKDNIMRDKKKIKLTHSEERLQILKQITKRNSNPAQNELDETDLFFNSIAKIVKKLPRYEQVQLRMQISSLVGNAELESILNESRQTDSSTSPSSTMSFIHLEAVPSPATSGTSNHQGQIVEMDGSYDVRKEVKMEENLNGNEREAGRKDGRTIKKEARPMWIRNARTPRLEKFSGGLC